MRLYLQTINQALEHITAVKKFQIKEDNHWIGQNHQQNKQWVNAALKSVWQEVFGCGAAKD